MPPPVASRPGWRPGPDATFAPSPDAPAPAPTPPGPGPGPGPAPRLDGGFGPSPRRLRRPARRPPPMAGSAHPRRAPAPRPNPARDRSPRNAPPPPAPRARPAATIECGPACVQGTTCPPAPGIIVACGLCNVDADCSLVNSGCNAAGPCECQDALALGPGRPPPARPQPAGNERLHRQDRGLRDGQVRDEVTDRQLIFTLPPLMRLTPRSGSRRSAPRTITLPSRRRVMLASPHFRTTSSAPSSTTRRPSSRASTGGGAGGGVAGAPAAGRAARATAPRPRRLDQPEDDRSAGHPLLERQDHRPFRGDAPRRSAEPARGERRCAPARGPRRLLPGIRRAAARRGHPSPAGRCARAGSHRGRIGDGGGGLRAGGGTGAAAAGHGHGASC